MKIVGPNRRLRTVYAFKEGEEFMLSPVEKTKDGRRPIARFDSKEQLEAALEQRSVNLVWLDG